MTVNPVTGRREERTYGGALVAGKVASPPKLDSKCPRCGKTVYLAERVLGPRGIDWHKQCLRCKECTKPLDQGTVAEHDQEAYCRPCHTKCFGGGKQKV